MANAQIPTQFPLEVVHAGDSLESIHILSFRGTEIDCRNLKQINTAKNSFMIMTLAIFFRQEQCLIVSLRPLLSFSVGIEQSLSPRRHFNLSMIIFIHRFI